MRRSPSQGPPARAREHPWERERRLAFARWEAELRRVPYGRSLPDVVGFASSIEPPAEWDVAIADRRLFALSALPTGPGTTFLGSLPPKTRRPVDGSLVRLLRPVKRVLPVPGTGSGELLLDVRGGLRSATWEETVPGVSPRAVGELVPSLAQLWHLPASVVERLLMPVVASTPWHGRPAGLALYLEVEGWSLARHRSFLSDVVGLAPAWVGNVRRRSAAERTLELVSGARIRRGTGNTLRPYSIQLRPISAPPVADPTEGAPPRSVISYGSALTAEFEALFSAGEITLLLSAEEGRRVPSRPVEIPDDLRATVWGLHWWTPEPPDTPEWHDWLAVELPRLRAALAAIPPGKESPPESRWTSVVDRIDFRERLAQVTIARARLRGGLAVEPSDLRRAVDDILETTQRLAEWARMGRGPLARPFDRSEAARTNRLRRSLEAWVLDRPGGVSVEEAVQALGAGATPWSVEDQLERLRIRGVLFQDRQGRYHTA